MYRVFDNKKQKWVTKNIYLMPNNKLVKMIPSIFGCLKFELYNERYVLHQDIGLNDSSNKLIFIGDYLKCKVSEDKIVYGLVCYAPELSSYIILCEETNEFYTLGNEVTEFIEVVGNVFDGYDGEESDGNKTL